MSEGRLGLMGILAHPDDESLGLGGIFARYAAEGVRLSLLTATHGQSGRYLQHRPGSPEHPGIERLAELREAELRRAAAVLGITELTLLGYVDGRLDQVDPREAIARIAHHVRRLRPQVAVTFAPDGAYGHPDHIAISQFATAALVAAADAGFRDAGGLPPHAVAKLYYLVMSAEEMTAYQEAFKKLTSLVDGVEREPVPWPEWEITTTIETPEHWSTVWEAVRCHSTQVDAFEGLKQISPEHHRVLWGRRSFYRAYSLVNGGRRPETDLFEGLRG